MGSTVARCLLLLVYAAVAAGAQEPPGFLIETITVEGLEREAARQIVLSESLLREGKTYAEAELREAVYRVKRLPFVVDADMALKKGSERGAYELVITVDAAKPIAYSVEVEGDVLLDLFSPSRDHFDEDDDESFAVGTFAARKFIGNRGLLFGNVQASDEKSGNVVQLGYTRYGLFRPGGFASVALSNLVGGYGGDDDLQGSLQVGIPVFGNHVLRGGAAWTRLESDTVRVLENPDDPARPFDFVPVTLRSESFKADLQWIFDTTNDPLLPTEGLRVTTRASYTTSHDTRRSRSPRIPKESDSDTWRLRSEGSRHWAATPRQSLALRVGGSRTHRDVRPDEPGSRNDEDLIFIEVTHALDLWDLAKRQRVGDLRWENGVGVEHFHGTRTTFLFDRQEPADEVSLFLRSSLLFRNAWGLVRVALTYSSEG